MTPEITEALQRLVGAERALMDLRDALVLNPTRMAVEWERELGEKLMICRDLVIRAKQRIEKLP